MWLVALATSLLNLLLLPRLRRGAAAPLHRPFVSVIIPARDEERAIERTVRAMLAQTYEDLEVIVVDDRSTDRTGAILAAIGDPRLVVVHGEDDPPPGWLGKPWALAQGSRRARGEILLFVDADIHYEPETVALAVAELQRSGASLVALLPRFVLRGFWENAAMPQLALVALSVIPVWLANRNTNPKLGIGGGPGNLVVRADYDAAGHEALRGEVVDDVGLARLLRAAGRRTIVVRADDFVSLRMYHGLAEVVDGFTKNLFATMGRNYAVALTGLVLMLIGQLLPYVLLFVSSMRAMAIAIVGTITLVRVVLFTSLRYRLDNALFLHPVLVAVWTWIFLRSMWVTGVRNELRWRGRTYPR
jgi:chlorobactene glucosyltransferase